MTLHSHPLESPFFRESPCGEGQATLLFVPLAFFLMPYPTLEELPMPPRLGPPRIRLLPLLPFLLTSCPYCDCSSFQYFPPNPTQSFPFFFLPRFYCIGDISANVLGISVVRSLFGMRAHKSFSSSPQCHLLFRYCPDLL